MPRKLLLLKLVNSICLNCLQRMMWQVNLLKLSRKVVEGIRCPSCATRWTARISTLSARLAKCAEVLKVLEAIRDNSIGDARSDSASYI